MALFKAEAASPAGSLPVRGIAAGAVLLAGELAMDLTDTGMLADASLAHSLHALTVTVSGVGAGVALRNRAR